MRGVLNSFLATYTSRYSDYAGYWLMGFLLKSAEIIRIDLLAAASETPDGPVGAAYQSAVERFRDQFQKGRFTRQQLAEARLTIEQMPGQAEGVVNETWSAGRYVRFSAEAILRDGRCYRAETTVFVAPHNPSVERRSSRA